MVDNKQAHHDFMTSVGFDKNCWPNIFGQMRSFSSPISMLLADVAHKQSYRFNFEAQLKKFIAVVQAIDDTPGDNVDVKKLIDAVMRAGIIWHDTTDFLTPLSDKPELEQASILYALICIEGTIIGGDGQIIRKRLMQGKNKQKNTDYLQDKKDEEYLDYMEHDYKNFCVIVDILKPKKSKEIKIIAGYLILG